MAGRGSLCTKMGASVYSCSVVMETLKYRTAMKQTRNDGFLMN